jgi:hypothetical protein
MATKDRYIHFVSKGWVGQSHDYKQLKYEFPPDQPWFKDLAVMLDLGYQDFAKDYDCQVISQPGRVSYRLTRRLGINKSVRVGFMLSRVGGPMPLVVSGGIII